MRRAPAVLPSLLDLCPRLRPRARRASLEIRRLVRTLVAAFPDAAFLAREPRAAQWMDTTPWDHAAADLIVSARALSDALSGLDDPP
jgi:hypothetical protein